MWYVWETWDKGENVKDLDEWKGTKRERESKEWEERERVRLCCSHSCDGEQEMVEQLI